MLCTLTKNSSPHYREIAEFYKEIGASGFHTNPYVHDTHKPIQEHRLGLTPDEYAQYFKNQFDLYMELDEKMLKPSYISSLMHTISGVDRGQKCTHGGRCLTNFLNIDDQGNAAICPKFLGYTHMQMGNIKENTVSELISPDNPIMNKFIEQRLKTVNGCEAEQCSYLMVCNSGCPYDSFLNGTDSSIEHRDYLCPGKHELYEHIDNKLQSYGVKTITSVQGGVIVSSEKCGDH